MTSHSSPVSSGDFLLALIVLVPLAALLMRRAGMPGPGLIAIAVAAFAVWVLPEIPGSPDACLAARQHCHSSSQLFWLGMLALVAPLAIGGSFASRGKDGTQ
jgi:hypothetical protein